MAMEDSESANVLLNPQKKDEDEQTRAVGWTLGRDMLDYVERLNSLVTAVQLFMKAFDSYQDMTMSHIRQYAEEHNLNLEHSDTEGTLIVTYGQDDVQAVEAFDRSIKRGRGAYTVIPRSLFVSMVSEYETLLDRLLTTVFTLQPAMCNQLKMPSFLTVEKALTFESIGAMRQHIIDAEVEHMMRGNSEEQLEYLNGKAHVDVKKICDGVPEMYEASERRNLYVHCDGHVSQQYLNECSRLHAKPADSACEGTIVEITPAYFFATRKWLLVLGLEIGTTVWWNVFPQDRDQIASFINDDVLLALLSEGSNEAAAVLGEYALKQFRKGLLEPSQRCIIINTAQAYKWNGAAGQCSRMLKSVNWDASADYLKLGVAVLKENYGKVVGYMMNMGSHGYVTQDNYRDWPLFKEFRNTPEFADAYARVFGQPFRDCTKVTTSIVSVDASKEEASDAVVQQASNPPAS